MKATHRIETRTSSGEESETSLCRREHQHANELPSGPRLQWQLLLVAIIVWRKSTVFFLGPKLPFFFLTAGTFQIKVISQDTTRLRSAVAPQADFGEPRQGGAERCSSGKHSLLKIWRDANICTAQLLGACCYTQGRTTERPLSKDYHSGISEL